MKATVENVKSVLASILNNTADYFTEITKCDDNNVILSLSSTYKHASFTDVIEATLEENFELTFIHSFSFISCSIDIKIMLTSK